MKIVTLFAIITLTASCLTQVSEIPHYMPHRTEAGNLKFNLHNLNPVNMYKVIRHGMQANQPGDINPKKHCKNYNEKGKECLECDEGYYLDSNKTQSGFCSACSDAIANCFSCEKVINKKTKLPVVVCESCNFPKMPNKDQTSCVGRTVLLWYFIVYVAIALVLAVLTCIENPKDEDDKTFAAEPSTLTKGLISENDGTFDDNTDDE
jgi:hypothetical protein